MHAKENSILLEPTLEVSEDDSHFRMETCMLISLCCRLIFAGKQMNDEKQAKEYNIEGGSVLHLVSQST